MKREKRPPLGVKPRFLIEEKRIKELQEAIKRYILANHPIPIKIIEEYNEKVSKLKEE